MSGPQFGAIRRFETNTARATFALTTSTFIPTALYTLNELTKFTSTQDSNYGTLFCCARSIVAGTGRLPCISDKRGC